MRIVVTGGRDFNDKFVVFNALHTVHESSHITLLGHGACHYGGADILAELWAKEAEIPYMGIPAKWGQYGKAAGMRRNVEMLLLIKPELVVAFPGGTGTAGCKQEARKRGIEVREFS